jgi:tetratricopeptide (TPR) repeat protein
VGAWWDLTVQAVRISRHTTSFPDRLFIRAAWLLLPLALSAYCVGAFMAASAGKRSGSARGVREAAGSRRRSDAMQDAKGLEPPVLAIEDAAEGAGRPASADTKRAKSILKRGRVREAVAILDGLLAREPGHGPALALRGEARRRLGEWPEALRDFEAALAISPDQPKARRGAAESAEACGDVAGALRHWVALFAMTPDRLQLAERVMRLALLLPETDAAEGLLAAVAPDLRRSSAFKTRIELRYRHARGDLEGGRRLIRDIDETVFDARDYSIVSRFQRQTNDIDAALETARRGLARYPDTPALIGDYLFALWYCTPTEDFHEHRRSFFSRLSEDQARSLRLCLEPILLDRDTGTAG